MISLEMHLNQNLRKLSILIGDNMKILHVAETIKGGIASHLDEILPYQIKNYGNKSVRVICPHKQLSYLERVPHNSVITFNDSDKRLINSIKIIKAVKLQIESLNPDIVHLHSTYAGFSIRLYLSIKSIFKKTPAVIYCPHGWSFLMDVGKSKKIVFRLIERILARFTKAIINVSEYEYKAAIQCGIPKSKQFVVLNGISDLSNRYEEKTLRRRPGINLLYIGRFSHQKGTDLLFDAAFHLSSESITFHLVGDVYGDFKMPSRLASNVELYGWQPRKKISALIAEADAILLPSRWEGLPITGIEAMRGGRAVIASDRTSLPELVGTDSGIAIPIPDGERLAEALRGLSINDLKKMGENARKRYKTNFTAERQCRELSELYKALIDA